MQLCYNESAGFGSARTELIQAAAHALSSSKLLVISMEHLRVRELQLATGNDHRIMQRRAAPVNIHHVAKGMQGEGAWRLSQCLIAGFELGIPIPCEWIDGYLALSTCLKLC